jgi:hypothetical protein
MITGPRHVPRLEFLVPADSVIQYATLLQTGILEERNAPITVGEFLVSLPGFTLQYVRERVETIFLNGLPVDDLETRMYGPSPVLAISGVMPGLAGAIFRKNSFHAALRTSTPDSLTSRLPNSEKITIRLKLFNVIAAEKGATLLHNGCFMSSDSILKFMNYRCHLFSHLQSLRYDDKPICLDDLRNLLLASETVFLRIQENNVGT